MGCHTSYLIPHIRGKENIISYLKDKHDSYQKEKWWNEECEKEYDFLKSLGGYDSINFDYDFSDVNNYKEGDIYDVISYNVHSNNMILKSSDNYILYKNAPNDDCPGDSPRIGGYPDNIIKSYDEMVNFINSGFKNDKDQQIDFHFENDKDFTLNLIKIFFEKHPEGIISFG